MVVVGNASVTQIWEPISGGMGDWRSLRRRLKLIRLITLAQALNFRKLLPPQFTPNVRSLYSFKVNSADDALQFAVDKFIAFLNLHGPTEIWI
jgi:hypothetical protein